MKRLAIIAVASCGLSTSLAQSTEQSISLAQGAGRDLTVARCVICHSLDYVQMNAPVMSRERWESSVRKMIAFGAPVTEQEAKQIVDYLSEHYSGG